MNESADTAKSAELRFLFRLSLSRLSKGDREASSQTLNKSRGLHGFYFSSHSFQAIRLTSFTLSLQNRLINSLYTSTTVFHITAPIGEDYNTPVKSTPELYRITLTAWKETWSTYKACFAPEVKWNLADCDIMSGYGRRHIDFYNVLHQVFQPEKGSSDTSPDDGGFKAINVEWAEGMAHKVRNALALLP